MKKIFIILLCMLALFAVASCKNDPTPTPTPEPTPTPTPTPGPEPEPVTSVIYILTAGSSGDRFQLKWADEEFDVGDTVSFKFKGITLKEYTIRAIDPAAKIVNCASFTGDPDSEGWYSFNYEVPEYTAWADSLDETPEDLLTGLGISLFPVDTDNDGVKVAQGDVLRIKDLAINGNELSLGQENSWPGVSLTITIEE